MASSSAPRGTRRSAAQKEASQIVGSLGSVVQMAFEKELQYLIEKLRENPPTVYMLSSIFKDDTLTALLANMATGLTAATDPAAEKGPEDASRRRFRSGLKKFRHFGQHCSSFIQEVLRALEPDRFPSDADLRDTPSYDLLKIALCVEDDTDFIATYIPECIWTDRCMEAFKLRYESMKKPLQHFTKEQIAANDVGYYIVRPPLDVVCIFEVTKVLSVGFGAEVKVVDPSRVSSEAAVVLENNRRCKIELKSQFEDLGVQFPDMSTHWKLEGFESKEDDDTKSVASASAACSSPVAKGLGQDSAWISDSLRKRLQDKKKQTRMKDKQAPTS